MIDFLSSIDVLKQRKVPFIVVESNATNCHELEERRIPVVGLSGLAMAAVGYGLAGAFGALIGEAYRPVLIVAALALPFWAMNTVYKWFFAIGFAGIGLSILQYSLGYIVPVSASLLSRSRAGGRTPPPHS